MTENVEKDYFVSYGDLSVHELMLCDTARVKAYKEFFEQNEALIKNKIVLDVGAGTGILSLLAAKAGAKRVFAVEASDVSHLCEAIVKDNGLEQQITVIHGRVEDISLPDSCKADIIVSEWMGFYLLHESMFDSVILAREKFLAPGGIMVPSEACLYACPITMTEYYRSKFDVWKNYCGFNFALLGDLIKCKTFSQPVIHDINVSHCIAEPELIFHMDMHFADKEDFELITRCLKYEVTKNSVFHGLSFWFEVYFPEQGNIVLNTGPNAVATHWKQTTVCLNDPLLVSKEDVLKFTVQLKKDPENKRRYEIDLTFLDDDDNDDSDDFNENEYDNDMESNDLDGFDVNIATNLLREAMERDNS